MLLSDSFIDADWANHTSLLRLLRLRHRDGIPDARYRPLREASRKCTRLPDAFGREFTKEDAYLQKIGILVMAKVPYFDRICGCGLPGYRGKQWVKQVSCGQRRFCQRCNYGSKMKKKRTYAPAFERSAKWFAIHVSFANSVNFCSYMGASLEAFWDAAHGALRALSKNGVIDGLFGGEELHVESFWPEIRVLPHIHAVVAAGLLEPESLAQTLEARIAEYLAQAVELDPEDAELLEDLRPAPTVVVKEISHPRHLQYAVGYCVKTMNVVAPYVQGIEATTPDTRWKLNQNVREFFDGFFSELDTGDDKKGKPMARRQLFAYGNLRPGNSPKFIGAPPKERRKQNATVYGLMEMINDDDEMDNMWDELRSGNE